LNSLGDGTPQRVGDVDLTALEHRDPRELVGHGPEHETLDAGALSPVLLVRIEHELHARIERDEPVRPGPHRGLLEALVTDLFDVFPRDDPRRSGCGRRVEGEKVGPRLLELKADAVRVNDLDLPDSVFQ